MHIWENVKLVLLLLFSFEKNFKCCEISLNDQVNKMANSNKKKK